MVKQSLQCPYVKDVRLPNVHYYLNPAKMGYQIPSNTGKEKGRDNWSVRDRGVGVGEGEKILRR